MTTARHPAKPRGTIRINSTVALITATFGCLTLTAACAGPHGGATGSDVAGCAAVLPLARDAVHSSGTLILVRKINGEDVADITREAGVTPPPPTPKRPRPPEPNPAPKSTLPKTCLIVYHGDYPSGTIATASPPATAGTYALIVLKVRHPAVDRILITNQLPPSSQMRPWWHIF